MTTGIEKLVRKPLWLLVGVVFAIMFFAPPANAQGNDTRSAACLDALQSSQIMTIVAESIVANNNNSIDYLYLEQSMVRDLDKINRDMTEKCTPLLKTVVH